MSLGSRIFTALLGLGLVWYFWPFGGGAEVVTPVSPPEKQLFTRPAAAPAAPQAAAPTQSSPQTADTRSGHAIAAPEGKPSEKAEAERVAALPAGTAPKPVVKPKLFYRVVVRDGGTLEAEGIVITLDGIKTYDAGEQCKDGKGRRWACGIRARAALTRLIHGRAVNCKVPQSGTQKSLTARCRVGRTDLSVWMVKQGWAKPAAQAEPKLAKAADSARQKKLGIWR